MPDHRSVYSADLFSVVLAPVPSRPLKFSFQLHHLGIRFNWNWQLNCPSYRENAARSTGAWLRRRSQCLQVKPS
jgi:hypothetical protein